jgi:hypothetical protein
MHIAPTQQSALMVHDPLTGTQVGPASELTMQRRTPTESGTQGVPLQQSAAEAQVSPAWRQGPPALQRGTPSASSWQAPELPTAPQQSSRADEMLHA